MDLPPLPPHDEQAERALLAAMVYDESGGYIDSAIAAGLTPDSFFDWANGAIWGQLVGLRASGMGVDTVSLVVALSKAGVLERAGGASYVTGLSAEKYSPAGFKTHLEIVLTAECQRKALHAVKEAAQTLSAAHLTRDGLASDVAVPLAKVENALHRAEKVRTLDKIVAEAGERAIKRIEGRDHEIPRIFTGLAEFDKWATPIEQHELVVVAARPSLGKSSLLRQIVWENVILGKRCACFLLETSDVSFIEGCAAQEAKCSVRGIKDEPDSRRDAYALALNRIGKLANLKVYDHDLTMDAIESRCRVLKQAYKPELVTIDYLQIVQGRKTDVSTADAIGNLTGRCAGLVKLLGCPVIIASQLNRSQERESNRQPVLSDLRDSGSIEADAHRVIFIHRPDKDETGMDQLKDAYREFYFCNLVQAKLRDGPKANIGVRFASRYATFTNKDTK